MITSSRNKKSQGVRDTSLTPRMGEDEQPLLETIPKIVKDELASHELAIKEMINDNIKITNDRLDRISQDVTHLKQSLEFTQEQMKEEINKIKKDLKDLDKNINEVQQDLLDPKYVSSKLIELEDRSRRNNLRIDGIDEKPNKTWDECESPVQELIDVNLDLTDTIEFERCHQISTQTNSSKNQNRSRTIICKVTKFTDKQKILKSAKCLNDKEIFIYEDFCKNTMDLRKKIIEQSIRKSNITNKINLCT